MKLNEFVLDSINLVYLCDSVSNEHWRGDTITFEGEQYHVIDKDSTFRYSSAGKPYYVTLKAVKINVPK
jgi:hypothetical protein